MPGSTVFLRPMPFKIPLTILVSIQSSALLSSSPAWASLLGAFLFAALSSPARAGSVLCAAIKQAVKPHASSARHPHRVVIEGIPLTPCPRTCFYQARDFAEENPVRTVAKDQGAFAALRGTSASHNR